MRFPRSFRIHCSLARMVLVAALPTLWIHTQASTAFGQEVRSPQVVALDHSSATLLRDCYPSLEFEVLLQADNERFHSVNARAWLVRDASCLVFRSDRLSMTSQLFRERLMSQGVQTIDIAAHASTDRSNRKKRNSNPQFGPPSQKQLIAAALTIDSTPDQSSRGFRP